MLWEKLGTKPGTSDETIEYLLAGQGIQEDRLLLVTPESVTLWGSNEKKDAKEG